MIWIILSSVAIAAVSVAVARHRERLQPTIAIATAPEAVAIRIRGQVRTTAPLAAPLTHRACAYWRVEYRTVLDGRAILATCDARGDFSVDDGTGLARVTAEGATFQVIADIVETGRARNLSEAGRAFIRTQRWRIPDVGPADLFEAAIVVDQSIDVAGIATREPALPGAGELGYREGATVLVFSTEHLVEEPARARRVLYRAG